MLIQSTGCTGAGEKLVMVGRRTDMQMGNDLTVGGIPELVDEALFLFPQLLMSF
jgi:hypothetical protein